MLHSKSLPLARWSALLFSIFLTADGLAQGGARGSFGQAGFDQSQSRALILPPSVPDPLEPLNRSTWASNRAFLVGVVQPTAKVYRSVVAKPVRTGLENFSKNIVYPGRLLNNLFQGKWTGARNETERFLCNSTIGLGGLFDVATHWNLPPSDLDFGQTFGTWGWKPHTYLVLPLFGPSNERDALGVAAEVGVDPLTYLPSPYSYYSYGTVYNNLAGSVDDTVRLAQSEKDPYSELQYAWTFARSTKTPDLRPKGAPSRDLLETLGGVFARLKDPEFPNRGETRTVFLPGTGKKLKYTLWLQPGHAPIAYVIPGLGAYRLAHNALNLSEILFRHGFSVVTISNPFHFEFMESASTAAVPGYTPADVHDVHVALTEIDHQVEKHWPSRIGARALVGYSKGGFETLYVAAVGEHTSEPLLKFDRYLAINAPVRLNYGFQKLDAFYEAPLAWPAAERMSDLENTLLKVAAVSKVTPSEAKAGLPFGAAEAEFLIGLSFRYVLRDIIYSSQERINLGILQTPIQPSRRAALYEEIMGYSYGDYFRKFLIPYYRQQGIDLGTPGTQARANDLRTFSSRLRTNDKVRVIANENDFVIGKSDLAWLRSTIPASRRAIFAHGGHVGNLTEPEVETAIARALAGLSSAR